MVGREVQGRLLPPPQGDSVTRVLTKEEVAGLAELADLAPGTLAWLSEPAAPPATPPPPRYAYVPLTDAEWSAVSPHWPVANQARTSPRDIVNALLMIASSGCGWGDVGKFSTVEAARQQMKRRAKSGVLKALPNFLRGQIDDGRLGQFVKLAALDRG